MKEDVKPRVLSLFLCEPDLFCLSLPASLSLLPNLKVLLLEGNPLRGIRRDMLTVGDALQ